MTEPIQNIPPNAAPDSVNPAHLAPAPLVGLALMLALGVWGWRTLRWQKRPAPAAERLRAERPRAEMPRFSQPLQWISAGKQQEKAGQFEAAIALYEEGLKFFPNDFRLWHERGLALAKAQQFEAAIASYDRAYELRPRQRDLAHERGDALLQLGRYEEAIASFDLFLQFVPNNSHILTDRGYALLQLGQPEAALHSLRQALKSVQLDPQSKQLARYHQIEALRQLGQFEAALQVAQQAMAEHPSESFRALHNQLRQQIGEMITH